MSKKKIKKNTQSNLKIFEFSPENIIDGTKKNIGNFFQNLKKDTHDKIIFCLNFLSIKIQNGKVKEINMSEIAKII